MNKIRINILLLGDSIFGKNELILKYCEEKIGEYMQTYGMELKIKEINLYDWKVNLHICNNKRDLKK